MTPCKPPDHATYTADWVIRLMQHDASGRIVSTSYMTPAQGRGIGDSLNELFTGRIIEQIDSEVEAESK